MEKIINTRWANVKFADSKLTISSKCGLYDVGLYSICDCRYVWPVDECYPVVENCVKEVEIDHNRVLSITDTQDITIDYKIFPYIGRMKSLIIFSVITSFSVGMYLWKKH